MNLGDMCATVLVNGKNGPVRINKTKYDANPEKYTLADPSEIVAAAPQSAPEASVTGQTGEPTQNPPLPPTGDPTAAVVPPPPTPPNGLPTLAGLLKEGAKWFIVDMNRENAKIGDANGYPSKAKAQDAAKEFIKA